MSPAHRRGPVPAGGVRRRSAGRSRSVAGLGPGTAALARSGRRRSRSPVVKSPQLDAGERLLASFGGSRQTIGSGAKIGGRIFLTDRRLIHAPGAAERLLRRRPWTAPLADIGEVEVGGRLNAPVGALGQAVVVTLASGEACQFLVWRGDGFADQLRAAREGLNPATG
jgi:hypothetical protein